METAPIVEPFVVQDTFVSGFGRLEEPCPGIVRLVLVADQTNGDLQERVVVTRIVGPRAALRDVALAILQMSTGDRLDSETQESIAAQCGTARPQ